MNITGLDTLIFAVEDLAEAGQFLCDYGLIAVTPHRFEALDGTGIEIYHESDPALPPGPSPHARLRCTMMHVGNQATLDAIGQDLARDRPVRRLADGAIRSVDDCRFAIGFRVDRRRALDLAGEISNAPGSRISRAVNSLGVIPGDAPIRPLTLSHVVYFVPDYARAEAFYVERLGFRCTDRFEKVGPFLQPAGTLDHHTHFFIQAPPAMTGPEHFTFHFAGPTAMMTNGYRFIEKGAQAFWGPGRHIMGSNWFWYFNSPFGCHIEMDADMDRHDARWQPRALGMGADNSQSFLLKYRPRWSPGPGTPVQGDYA